jgi:hypothetical protein
MARRAALGLVLAAAAALLALGLAAPAAAAGEPPEWAVWRRNVKAMRAVGGSTIGEILGPFLDYEFSLPMHVMRRAQVRRGAGRTGGPWRPRWPRQYGGRGRGGGAGRLRACRAHRGRRTAGPRASTGAAARPRARRPWRRAPAAWR